MPRIPSVTIRRFKRLEEVQIALGDATLLIGANNSGKSSILQAVHFAVSIAQSARLVGEGVSWRNDAFEVSFNPAQLIYSPVADVLSLATGGTLQEQRPTQIEIEFVDDTGSRWTVGLRRGRNRNIAVSILGRQVGELLMDLEHPFTVYAPGLAGVPKEERYLSPGVVRRIVARGDANLALRNVLRMLRAIPDSWNLFVEDMQSIFDGISVEITFNENTDENIRHSMYSSVGLTCPLPCSGRFSRPLLSSAACPALRWQSVAASGERRRCTPVKAISRRQPSWEHTPGQLAPMPHLFQKSTRQPCGRPSLQRAGELRRPLGEFQNASFRKPLAVRLCEPASSLPSPTSRSF